MTRLLSALLLAALATGAQAQDTPTPEDAAANALILPMLQELSPQDGAVLAACVVATALPEEKAAMAAAPGPSMEIGALISTILARPDTIGCIQATLAG